MSTTIMIDRNFLPLFEDMVPSEFILDKPGDFLLGALNDDGEACGVLWYRFNSMNYDILFIGTHPTVRRKGIGTYLLNEFINSVYKSNLLYPVRVSFEDVSANATFKKFLMKFGKFNIKFDSFTYLVSKETRETAEMLEKLEHRSSNAVEYGSVPSGARHRFENMLHEKGFFFLNDINDHVNRYIPEMCYCTLDSKGISAAVFFKKSGEDSIELSFAYGSTRDLTAILRTFSEALRKVKNTPYSDYDLRITAVNDSSKKLAEFMFGDKADRIPVCIAEWKA